MARKAGCAAPVGASKAVPRPVPAASITRGAAGAGAPACSGFCADGSKKGNVEYSWKVEEGEAALIEDADPPNPGLVQLIETPVRKS